jgi:hypothetical protein
MREAALDQKKGFMCIPNGDVTEAESVIDSCEMDIGNWVVRGDLKRIS